MAPNMSQHNWTLVEVYKNRHRSISTWKCKNCGTITVKNYDHKKSTQRNRPPLSYPVYAFGEKYTCAEFSVLGIMKE